MSRKDDGRISLTDTFILNRPALSAAILLLFNFLLRILVYYKSSLFNFSDYGIYLQTVDRIESGEWEYLQYGNLLYAISYIASFLKSITGSPDSFFILNSLAGTFSGLVIFFIILKVTGSVKAGLISLMLLSLYTEFIVFSSVFYTPVLMIFIVSLILLLFYYYLSNSRLLHLLLSALGITALFLLTFFFKPELKYLPFFLVAIGIFVFRKDKIQSAKLLCLSFFLLTFSFLLNQSGIITRPPGNVLSNSFVFFGHTDYGGKGGEGTFIYPESRERYEKAAGEYFKGRGISSPTLSDYNDFQKDEVKKFIIQHPVKWFQLQGKKFFRTFGIVPESTSYKVLYTGLLMGQRWITAFMIVVPVAAFIFLFIVFFPGKGFRFLMKEDSRLTSRSPESPLPVYRDRQPHVSRLTPHASFLVVYIGFFLYYLIAVAFYGQFQERYRMSIMVLFIIPAVSLFIANFKPEELFTRRTMIIKTGILLIFFASWVVQVRSILSDRERWEKIIERLDQQ